MASQVFQHPVQTMRSFCARSVGVVDGGDDEVVGIVGQEEEVVGIGVGFDWGTIVVEIGGFRGLDSKVERVAWVGWDVCVGKVEVGGAVVAGKQSVLGQVGIGLGML